MARGQRVEAIIALIGEDGLSELTKSIAKSIGRVSKNAKRAGRETRGMSRALRTSGERAAVLTTGLVSGLSLITQMASGAKALGENIRAGAIATETFARFGRVFENAAEAHIQLQKASRGGIDDTGLEKYALAARRAGLTINQTARLLDLAGKLSVETGKSVKESADDMFKAVSAGRVRTLQSVGVNIDLTKALDDQARQWGVTSTAIDQAAKVQIRFTEVARVAGEALDGVSTEGAVQEVDRLGTAYRNLVSRMQEKLAANVLFLAQEMDFGKTEDQLANKRVRDLTLRIKYLHDQVRKGTNDLFTPQGIVDGIKRDLDKSIKGLELLAHTNKEARKTLLRIIEVEGERGTGLAKLADAMGLQVDMEKALSNAVRKRSEFYGVASFILKEDTEALDASWKAAEDATKATEAAAKARESQLRILKDQVKLLYSQRQAAVDTALAQAKLAKQLGIAAGKQGDLAKQLGYTALATDLVAKAMKASKSANIDMTSDMYRLAIAANALNDELARQLLIRAQMARLAVTAKDDSGEFVFTEGERIQAGVEADVLTARAVGAIEGDTGIRPLKTPKGRGGRGGRGGEKKGPLIDVEADVAALGLDGFGEQVRADLAQSLRERETAAKDAVLEADIRRVDVAIAAHERLMESMTSFGAFSGDFEDDIVGNFQRTGKIVHDEVGRFVGVFKDAKKAGLSTGQAVTAAVPGAINAAGQMAGAWGASVQVQETMFGLADVAMAATKFAGQNYVSGGMYTVSAGLHFAAAANAGGAGGGGGGGGGEARPLPPPNMPSIGPGGQQRETGPAINIYMDGATMIGGDLEQAGRDIATVVGAEMSKRSGTSPQWLPV